jgi:hypothetical protein
MPRGINRYDEAILQRRLWEPTQISTALWFDAADLSTITVDTGLVSQWRDKSGNNRHVFQSGAARPFYSLTGGSNNLPRLFTTSQSRYLIRNTRFTTNGGFVIAVYKKDSSGAATNDGNRIVDISGTTNASEADKVGFSQGIRITESFAVSSTQWKIASGFRVGMVQTNSFVSIFGTLTHTGFPPFVATGWGDAVYDLIGSISEVIMLGVVPSVDIRNLLEGYLGWKWGISLSASHPFANRPPLIGD